MRVLSGDDVEALLPMPEAIALMQTAFVALSEGQAVAPVRTVLPVDEHAGRFLVMPAAGPSHAAVKLVSVHDANPARGLPLVHALVLVAEATTGRPLALLDGERLTDLRTGAASGLATDLLARPEASVVAVFGAGRQAHRQLEAVCAVRPIRCAYVVSRTEARAHAFAEATSGRLGVPVRVARAAEALAEADVVCTATTSAAPVFAHAELRPGTHINGVGSYRPDLAEVPPETVAAARVVVDHRASCRAEAGDLLQPLRAGLIDASHIETELGDVAAGRAVGRRTAAEVTFFKSVGNAVQDLVAAAHVAEAARRRGFGTIVEI